MRKKPSTHEHILSLYEQDGEPRMEKTAQELIKRMKQVKSTHKISYPQIIEQMEENHKINDKLSVPSLTTLRRVFAPGSETRASNYNFEETLLPIAEAIDKIAPTPDEVPAYIKEIEGLKSVIAVQTEELDRALEMNEHLNKRVDFLLEQIRIKDKRIDEKDEMIRDLLKKCL